MEQLPESGRGSARREDSASTEIQTKGVPAIAPGACERCGQRSLQRWKPESDVQGAVKLTTGASAAVRRRIRVFAGRQSAVGRSVCR